MPNASTEFHVYSMVWSPEKIVFSVDGVVHYTYDPDDKNPNTWPFDAPQYLIFNIAILPIISPSFAESSMEVDYVRVYQESPLNTVEQEGMNEVVLYPNPVADRFTISIEETSSIEMDVKIHTQNGKCVFQQRMQSKGGKLEINNIDELPSGLYIVSLAYDNKRIPLKFKKL